jgi:hypothetical protein
VVLDSRETDVVEYVRAEGLEIAQGYECSADAQALVKLSHAVRVAGTLIGLALGWSPAAFDTHSFVAKGQRMFGSCAYGNQDFGRALEMISSGRVDVEPLISERVSLEEAPDAFMRLRQPGKLVAVLVQPWRYGRGSALGACASGPAAHEPLAQPIWFRVTRDQGLRAPGPAQAGCRTTGRASPRLRALVSCAARRQSSSRQQRLAFAGRSRVSAGSQGQRP